MESLSEEEIFRLRRNLTDAGCDQEQIARFLELELACCRSEQYRMLARQKVALLRALHCVEYKIDCLDHLLYLMHKEDAQRTKNGGL